MEDYNKVYDYINYFEDTDKEFCTYSSGYPIYDEKFEHFIEDLMATDLYKYDYRLYLDTLEDSDKLLKTIGTEEIKEYIDNASLETVKAILTYYIRWHRWDDEIWNEVARMGIFYKLLTRIKILQIKER